MEQQVKTYLKDILSIIDDINRYIGGLEKFEDYKTNPKLQQFVVTVFEVISNLLDRILDLDSTVNISEASNIRKFNNQIKYDYEHNRGDLISYEFVRGVVANHLPRFKSEIEALLKKE